MDDFVIYIKYNTNYERELMGRGNLYIDSSSVYCTVNPIEAEIYYSCNLPPDTGSYTIIYATVYNEYFKFKVEVQNSEIFQLVYDDKQYKDDKTFIENNIRYIKFGRLSDGNFDLSEFKDDEYLTFYVKGIDNSGKPAQIRNFDKITESLRASCNSELILEHEKDCAYKIKVKVTKKGKYSISSNYLDFPTTFYVDNLVPSTKNSKCNIEDLSEKPYKSDVGIKYICEFKDEAEEPIIIKDAMNKLGVSFLCKINRLTDNDGTSFNPIQIYYDENIYVFIFKTDYNGRYQFEIQFGLDKMETIKSESFLVSPVPTSLEGSYFSDYNKKEWIHIDELPTQLFNYKEKVTDNSGSDKLFLIDLIDLRNKNKINKYSDIEDPFCNFDPSEIKGEITELHSELKFALNFTTEFHNNKYYIVAKLLESKSRMRRTTFNYTVSIEFGKKAELKMKYVLNKHGNYEVCGKNLNISNCIVNSTTSDLIKAGFSEKVGELVLRTDLDHLYNYYLVFPRKLINSISAKT
jgi:hypothetical protein